MIQPFNLILPVHTLILATFWFSSVSRDSAVHAPSAGRNSKFIQGVPHYNGVDLSYTWVKLALQGAGLVSRGRKLGVHRKRRPRRPLPGMLLHIDGSHHRWFQDERWYDLIVILDDATSEIYYAQLVEEESTVTVMAALREAGPLRALTL